jgi:DNA-binding PadR family transcriptional regulator
MSVKYCMLGLLQYKNMHGYELKKHIERNFAYMWSINFGQIYPNLKKMEEDGFVRVIETTSVGPNRPRKKLYSITSEGKLEFGRWLEGSPERNMLLRDPFLMRFVFFGFGDKQRALEIVDEQIKLYQDQLKTRKENYEVRRRQGMYVRLIAELGVELNEVFLAWLLRAREEILNGSESPAELKETVFAA